MQLQLILVKIFYILYKICNKYNNDCVSLSFQMTCGVSCVDRALNRSFFKLGHFIGRHPGYFLIVPVLLALLCMTG